MCCSSCRLRFGECTKLTRLDQEIQIAQHRDTTLEELFTDGMCLMGVLGPKLFKMYWNRNNSKMPHTILLNTDHLCVLCRFLKIPFFLSLENI